MQEAMRQCAPNSSRIAGAAVTTLALAGAGYALMTGARISFVPVAPAMTTIVTLPEKKEEPREDKPPPIDLKMDERLRPPALVPPDVPTFVAPDRPPIFATPFPPVGEGGSGGGIAGAEPAPPAPVAPRLRLAPPPPYPVAEIRAGAEGETGIEVCVDERGRVTDAKVVSPSGRPRLDEAALHWIKSARFEPGRVNGAPAAMCGQQIVYEWRLERARR